MKTIAIGVTIVAFALAASAQRSFYSKEYNIGFNYPAGAHVVKEATMFPTSEKLTWIAGATFKYVRGIPGGSFDLGAGKTTAAECEAMSTQDGDVHKRRFGTMRFWMTEAVEGGMESVVPEEFYRTYHDGICYEIHFGIPQEKYPKHPVNSDAGFRRMRAVLSTMYFRK